MTNFRALETQYKGYRFRSRLEAKWAVFFDVLGIEWVYEKEGYDLGEAGWYLPDFWLPQVKMWAEVKPDKFTDEENKKAQALVMGSGYEMLKLIGMPENKPYEGIFFEEPDSELGVLGGFGEVDYCLTMYKNFPISHGRFYCMPGDYGPGGDAYWDDTERAATAARSARFEHGENGR